MEEEITHHQALVAIFFDALNFENGNLIFKIVNQSLNLDITAPVLILKEIIPQDMFSQLKSFGENTVNICEKLIDHLIIC